ncbi:MAG: DUF5004 domain-containing protein [Bacteroidota bacterium]
MLIYRFFLLFICASLVTLTSCSEDDSVAEPVELRQAMLGTWVLAESSADDITRLKYWGLDRWAITNFNTTTGEVIFHHGGTYTLSGNEYTETITFAAEGTQDLIGTTYSFEIEIHGNTFTQRGTDNTFNEQWIRSQ